MAEASIREEFFKSLTHDNQIIKVFDLLPEIAFYLKDKESRFVALNRKTCEFCGVSQEEDALGKTDHDFFPKDRADAFRSDEFAVMESGQPIENRIQPYPQEGSDRVIVTSMIPLRNEKGEVKEEEVERRRMDPLRSNGMSLHCTTLVRASEFPTPDPSRS